MKPASPTSRIVLVDCLRGFALFGLFVVHMVEYFELYWYKPDPGWVHNLIFFLFGGKAYAIFSLLFGLSFFIIMDNQAKKGVDFRLRFAWRLTLLCVLGYLHGLLYSGDILQVLALTGFLLIFIYSLSNRWVLLLATVCLLQLPMLVQFQIGPLNDTFVGEFLNWEMMNASGHIYAAGSLTEVLSQNAFHGQAGKWMFMIESGRIWNIIGLFLVGFLLGRTRYFERYEKLRKASFFALAISAVLIPICLGVMDRVWSLSIPQSTAALMNGMATHYLNTALTATGILLFIFAYQIDRLQRALNSLAPCGRMTLTLYVGQSLIGVPLFYGFGLGLYDGFGQVQALALGILLWLFQMLLAHAWMSRFHYGPLEWLWRATTYLSCDVRWKK